MSSLTKLERDKQKLIQDKCQQILAELLRDDDNKYCVDCDSKGPRWASWNLGIFLCIRCAGIHRNLGVHISKVKSVNLDSWTPEQVGSIQNMGNSKARAVYEANLPDNFCRPQADSALESFIRAKYEQKKYIAKEWVETAPKPAFDVEAELKKEKEKKKNKVKPIVSPISAQTDIQSNPIPRPNTSVASKTDKGQQPQAKPEANSNVSTDLLGLDLVSSSNDEPFGFFASAETSSATTNNNESANSANPAKSLDDEEKDFFSQKVPDKADDKKLTKESILSLYSQAPSTAAMNGIMQAPAMANHLNQFPPTNQLFGGIPNQTNVMASTNPFLANNGNSGFPPSDYHQQSLVQGLNSLQLGATAVPSMSGGASQSHLGWFSTPTTASLTTPPTSNSMAPSVANPFLDTSNSSANLLNFNLNLSGNLNNSSTPNPTSMVTINNNNSQKESNFNFW